MLIALSGPQHARKGAAKSLEDAGFRVVRNAYGDPVDDSHGMPDTTLTRWTGATWQQGDIDALPDGKCRCGGRPEHGHKVGDIVPGTGTVEPVEVPGAGPVSWLTVAGDDANKANAAVRSAGWVVRSQMHEVEEQRPLTPAEKLAAIGLSPADLRSILAGG